MDLLEYLLRVLISLGVVVALILLALPYILRRLTGLRTFTGKGSFEVKKIQPLTRSVHLAEIEIKGKTFVILFSDKGADVIYREDDKDNPSPAGSRGDRPRSGEGDTSRRA